MRAMKGVRPSWVRMRVSRTIVASVPILLACWLGGIAVAFAQTKDDPLTRQYGACMDKAGGVTQGMVECADAETKRQDARLNKAYKALTGALTPERRKQLVEAQRAWIRFRDTNCAFYYDPDGGSMARIESSGCVMNMTAERARELEMLSR